jgi:hypothetical protein
MTIILFWMEKNDSTSIHSLIACLLPEHQSKESNQLIGHDVCDVKRQWREKLMKGISSEEEKTRRC